MRIYVCVLFAYLRTHHQWKVHAVSALETENSDKFAITRDLSIAAQKHHFKMSSEHGQNNANHQLLVWFADRFANLEQGKLKSDFSSPARISF